MRLRNIKGATEIVASNKYIITNPKEYKGNYNKLFSNNNPIHIEIGTGKGNFIISKALQNPNINFIGIEKYASVLIRCLDKLENLNIDNLKLINFDATDINSIFDKEIDTIYLNFSDPWPKSRHEKRRLTSPNFLEKYSQIFKTNERIIMKTDNRKLFEYSIQVFNQKKYNIEKISLDLDNDDIDNIKTEYEEKFISLGMPIYMIEIIK